MDENEVETLLANMVNKKNFRKGRKSHIWQIRYRDYMDVIYRRMTITHNCNLSETGRACLCLGYLWSRFQQSSSESYTSLNSILTEIAPEIDDTLITAKLYTEWGIWARISGNAAHAEELLRKVAEKHPKDIVSRTELGKLLLEQKSRKKEAEEVLREVIKIDAKNIMARTELGRLLVRQKGREKEAENILREALKIDLENLHPHTELGKLLAGQKGREKEAEDIFREAMRIDAKHVHSRTELGRLLARQKGREKEAEDIFREVIQIEPNVVHSRTELGKLLSKQKGREKEAEKILRKVMQIKPNDIPSRIVLARLYENDGRLAKAAKLYQEICDYNPGNPYGQRGLKQLKNYIKK
ncbi:MAG: tetratricopeptide repeat protein [Lachnospiraceae bacterium]|nr:tetratricopeptide repeat protein [Lachnospiraceae bacterium]